MSGKKKTEIRYLEMRDGQELRILGTTGRYWITQGAQFRKGNPDIVRVITREPEAED